MIGDGSIEGRIVASLYELLCEILPDVSESGYEADVAVDALWVGAIPLAGLDWVYGGIAVGGGLWADLGGI